VLLIPTYRHGTWATHLIAATTDIVVVPDDIDIVQLAMVGINPITALLLLRNYGDPSMDDRWIGQTAGNSAVGEYLIKLARRFGLTYRVPDEQRAVYQRAFVNLPFVNGDDSWELPIPATYIIDRDGTVLYVSANEDYTERPEPKDIIRFLIATLRG